MPRIKINGAELEIRDGGSGQPVVFVHGGMGDECAAVVKQRVLADHYRLIDYHGRGWGSSSRAEDVVSIAEQADDCRAVIEHIGVQRAHFVGQSYGGAILLQLALDAAEVVQSLALQEPPLPSVLLNSPAFGAVAEKAGVMYESGDNAGAIEAFATEMGGDDFRTECPNPGVHEHLLTRKLVHGRVFHPRRRHTTPSSPTRLKRHCDESLCVHRFIEPR
jgi:pimeloyl-ACP methyl ester carboxylesterase